MKKIISLLFICSLGLVFSQVDRSVQPKPDVAPKININIPNPIKLKNGLTVYFVENHKLPRVNIFLNYDNPLPKAEGDKAGVSSLLDVMLGNGTTNIPKDKFNDEVDYLGADINIATDGGFVQCLEQYFPRILELFADAIQNPLLVTKEFKKERDKLIEFLKTKNKDIDAVNNRVKNVLLYGKNHPYGEYTTEETLKNINLEDIKSLKKEHMTPTNAYLVIEGDFDTKAAKSLVIKYLGQWQKKTMFKQAIPIPKNTDLLQINAVSIPHAVQSKITIEKLINLNKNSPDYLAVRLANDILGGTDGNLFSNIREDKGYTYGAYSNVEVHQKTKSVFTAYASVRTQVTDSTIVEFLKEIKNTYTISIDEKRLKDAKAKFTGYFIRGMEDPKKMAQFAVNIQTQNLPDDFYVNYLKNIEAITVDDLKRVAEKYFTLSNCRIIVVGNIDELGDRLENISFEGKKIPVLYFDKYGNPTGKNKKLSLVKGVTAKRVFEKYIEAIGGSAKLSKVKSIYLEGKANIQGMVLSIVTKKMAPNKAFSQVKAMDNIMQTNVFNGKDVYMEVQGQKQKVEGTELNIYKVKAALFYELNLKNNKDVKLLAVTEIDGKKAYKIKITEGFDAYYDVDTGLKIKEVEKNKAEGQIMINETTYFDYKTIDGIKFASKMTVKNSSMPMEFTLGFGNIEVNGKKVSAEDFK